MSILAKALDELKYSIPMEILREAFKDDLQNWRQAPVSLDERILTKVIRPRVLVDTNLVGGVTTIVPLDGLTPKYVDTFTVLYIIPAERISYREIIAVLSVGYLPYGMAYGTLGDGIGAINAGSMTDVSSVAQRIGDAASSIPAVSNALVELVGYNTILIRDQLRVTNSYQLRCILANEENLNNINPRSYHNFCKLCELAVKAYIYNTLLIKIDTAYLKGGQELGSFKSYVESLSDANENYRTYLLEVWKSTAACNDTTGYDRFIKMQICPGL